MLLVGLSPGFRQRAGVHRNVLCISFSIGSSSVETEERTFATHYCSGVLIVETQVLPDVDKVSYFVILQREIASLAKCLKG